MNYLTHLSDLRDSVLYIGTSPLLRLALCGISRFYLFVRCCGSELFLARNATFRRS